MMVKRIIQSIFLAVLLFGAIHFLWPQEYFISFSKFLYDMKFIFLILWMAIFILLEKGKDENNFKKVAMSFLCTFVGVILALHVNTYYNTEKI